MSISFRRFQPEDRPGIEALNERLQRAGIADRVYPEADQRFETAASPVTQELYVAADGSAIHGGVWLHEQQFLIAGQTVSAGWLKYPVAESVIDRAYSGVPTGLILTLMRRQPLLMALGMGGRGSPLARLLEGMSWTAIDVPFGFAPLRATRVLKELRGLQSRPWLAIAARVLASTRTAPLVISPTNILRRMRVRRLLTDVTVVPEREFSDWSDRIWKEQCIHYPFMARRDARILNRMYPVHAQGIARFRIVRGGRDIAWLCTRAMGLYRDTIHPQFGRLKVGMIVDAVAHPSDAKTVFAVGLQELARGGADIVVSNQLHTVWCNAMKSLLLAPAPSNFVFAYSKAMKSLMQKANAEQELYITRGDCDGPPWW